MIHLIIPDPHAHYQHNNNRAVWLGELIRDIRPDIVINLGDTADLPSLASFDKGTRAAIGRSYSQDIAAASDFQDRLWSTVRKAKRKLPRRVTLIGNHEERIARAINAQPELEGTISYGDLELDHWYDTVVHYKGNTPGTICLDGVHYAHYFISGVYGRAISGEHPGYSLITKEFVSCTQGHTHVFDYCTRTDASGTKRIGLVAGCYFDYDPDWAGECAKLYWRGVILCRNVSAGQYDIQQISIETLKKAYGS